MTRIYLIRHAEAEGNLYRRVHGSYNSTITSRGKIQIAALAQRFRDVQIDALYSSDRKRTTETAGAILKYHPELTLITDPRLREMHLGVWEDMAWGTAEKQYPRQMYNFSNAPEKFDLEGAENFSDLTRRIRGAVFDIASRHDGQTIAIVSHGMAIRSLLADLCGFPIERTGDISHGDNTCVALLEISGDSARVKYHNDASHLDSSISTFAGQTWWRDTKRRDTSNLSFEIMDPAAEGELYKKCYGDAWLASHGDLRGFSPEIYLQSAIYHASKDPNSLMKVTCYDSLVGIIELDMTKGSQQGWGWISLCYLVPECRGKGLGVQLVGHAVSVFRSLGRSSIRLHVAECNEKAIRFYKRCGFEQVGTDEGVCTTLLLMELKL